MQPKDEEEHGEQSKRENGAKMELERKQGLAHEGLMGHGIHLDLILRHWEVSERLHARERHDHILHFEKAMFRWREK